MLTWQNEQGSQHSPWYGWEFCLLRSRNINETQSIENRIAVIDHKVTCSVISILDSFIRRWKKPVVEERLFWQVGTCML